MKKKIWIPIIIVVLLLILFVPISSGVYKDGGSRSYTALTYKIVDWNRANGNAVYDETSFYFFPNNFKSIDELWELELNSFDYPTLKLEIIEIKNGLVVANIVDNREGQPSGHVSFSTKNLDFMYLSKYDLIEVNYTGELKETSPMQIDVVDWKVIDIVCNCDEVHTDAPEWLDKGRAVKFDVSVLPENQTYFTITDIYSDCIIAKFFAGGEMYRIKLNGKTEGDWCVGDYVYCSYKNAYYDEQLRRIEADLITIESEDALVCAKPVIYLYPEKEIDVTVSLDYDGRLTCTYPAYNNGWTVTASPDGTLTDKNGKVYNYLYWEGETNARYDMSTGFCVKGDDTAEFLEISLEKLGLNRREANEFIVYWLPMMEQNEYNIISFQTDAYTDSALLDVNPAPDTLIRVFMAWQATDTYVELPEQELTSVGRNGFAVIEWGGTQIIG